MDRSGGRDQRNARVDRVHAWDGDHRFFNRDGISGLENEHFYEGFDVHHEIDFGLNMSVHLECLDGDPTSEAEFNGAGAAFSVD